MRELEFESDDYVINIPANLLQKLKKLLQGEDVRKGEYVRKSEFIRNFRKGLKGTRFEALLQEKFGENFHTLTYLYSKTRIKKFREALIEALPP
jgi:hypothetical protein